MPPVQQRASGGESFQSSNGTQEQQLLPTGRGGAAVHQQHIVQLNRQATQLPHRHQ